MASNKYKSNSTWIIWGIVVFVLSIAISGAITSAKSGGEVYDDTDDDRFVINYTEDEETATVLQDDYTDTQPDTDETTVTDEQNDTVIEPTQDAQAYMYKTLTEKQKEIYNTLLAKVPEYETDFSFNDIGYNDFDIAYLAFYSDHPEFFWLTEGYSYMSGFFSDFSVELGVFSYWTYSMNKDKYVREYNEKLDALVRKTSAYSTEYDKVKFVHDYLVENVRYDYDALEDINDSNRRVSTEHAINSYGAFINGKTVCEGYAEVMFLVLNRAGVNCTYFAGYAGEYHAWNGLEVDGDYYYIDVTWDDCDDIKDTSGKVLYENALKYSYFCVTSEEMGREHTPDKEYPAPYDNATDFSFYVKNGYYFDKYDFSTVRYAIEKQLGNDMIALKFGSEAELEKAINSLFSNGKLYDAGVKGQYVYLYDEKLYTLHIYL